MRKTLFLFLVGLSTIFYQCAPEEQIIVSEEQKVQFSVSLPDDSHDGGRTKQDLPDGASLV
jgi:hypothetical protein